MAQYCRACRSQTSQSRHSLCKFNNKIPDFNISHVWMEAFGCEHSNECQYAAEYFHVVFVYYAVQGGPQSVNKTLMCDHSNES